MLVPPALAQDDAPAPNYYICEWGLLTVDPAPVRQRVPVTFITIESPENYSGIDGTAFTLSGTGGGLFEGNIVVEVTADETVLFSEPTTLDAPDLGDPGTWALDVDLGTLDPATPITVTAFSTSPRDGSIITRDTVLLNANSTFAPRFVQINTPAERSDADLSPLVIEGQAGAAFENNIVIELRDAATDSVLAETFATIETDELGGSGPFSAEIMLEENLPPGTELVIDAYHPAIAEGETVTIRDMQTVVVSPLARTYSAMLVITPDDPILTDEALSPCEAAEEALSTDTIQPISVNDVSVMETRSIPPLVNVTLDAAGPSICPQPLRVRAVLEDATYAIDLYFDVVEPVPCTADLAPISRRISLGQVDALDYTLTVNGEPVE